LISIKYACIATSCKLKRFKSRIPKLHAMKTLLLLSTVLFVQIIMHAQHNHQMDHLFSDYNLTRVEQDLGFDRQVDTDFVKGQIIDSCYQAFFTSMEVIVKSGEQMDKFLFKGHYDQFLSVTSTVLGNYKPGNEPNDGGPKALDGPCENMDFEAGDLSGWELTRGNVDGSVPYSYVGEFIVGPGAYHQIFAGGVDPVCGIPRVNPDGGNFSARLGNGTGTGAQGARMRQTFLVDPTNYMYRYSYAVVFESPNGHTLNELPYFTVRVFDEGGASIACGEYSVIADAANAPDYETVMFGGDLILYKDWTTVFTNLEAFIGQNVTVEFTAGDCSLSGHFGYAYVDATCGLDSLYTADNTICQGETTLISAPGGVGAYLWSTGETTQDITVGTGGVYTCELTPLQGPACAIVLDIEIFEYPTPIADFSGAASACLNDAVPFTDLSTIPNPGSIATWQWDFGDGVVTPASSGAIVAVPNTSGNYTAPIHTYTSSGVFNVTLTVISSDGCQDQIMYPISINALPVVVAGVDQAVCHGTQVTLNGAGATSYSWNFGVVDGVPFSQGIGTVTYTLTGTDANGCENTDQVDVTVWVLPNVGAGADQAVCDGVAVTLNGSGAVNYAWDNGITNGIPFVQGVGTTTYTVTGTDANGCQNTDQVDVTVWPLPIVGAGVDQEVCEGTQVTLNGSGAVNYGWDNGVTNGLAFTPAVGTLTYTVSGTDANGCQNTDQVDVTVFALPNVSAGADLGVCEGSAITLSGSGAISYVWNNGVTDGVPFGQMIGTVSYTVIGTDANGCENTDQVDVTVWELPLVSAGPDVEICLGDQVTLNGSGAVNYVWNNGVSDGVAFVPALGSHTYTVIGTDLNGCSANDEVEVFVHALPVVSAGPDVQVCQNVEVTLSGSGAVNYAWDNGVTNGIAFLPAVGTLTYTVTGTDANGCQNSDQVEVTVLALPIVEAGDNVEVCEGTVVVLNASGAIDYAWDNGIMNGVPFTPGLGTTIYSVIGTDVNGCENSDQLEVTVHGLPAPHAGPDQIHCEGTAITLSSPGGPFLAWDNGVQNGIPFYQNAGIVVYVVYDTTAFGCTASDTVRIEVLPNPVISANGAEICEGEQVVLIANGGVSYSWSNGVQNGVPFYPTQSAVYTVTGTGVNGCSVQETVFVQVHPKPIASFDWMNLDISTTEPSTGFNNTSIGGSDFLWNFGDGSANSIEFEPFHEFPSEEGGIYGVSLTVTSPEGCVDEFTRFIDVKQDYNIFVPNAFTPDANGKNEIFTPILDGFDEQGYTLLIFNRWGQLVFESHNMEIGWDGSFAQRYDQAQDGVYTWKVVAKVKKSGLRKEYVGHVSLLK
jgi:gliding motility-associated-like protein